MPAATEPPSVALSFANNFWGKEDAGVGPLLERMAAAKQTNDELRSFYSARASIEEEYARKLMSLCRKSLGSHEMGTLKTSLDTVRGEVESMAKQHASIASQIKTELEEPLAAFAGGMKERRKIIQNTVEKLLKVKIQQTQHVNKTRDRYEQECLKIKGYLAQGHMVMGQEERKNKAKLEKTQISVATTNTEYENAVKALEDTTARWNREWKAAADKFQDLEEERLDFTKSSLWTFANISSTVCVSDDASCEKIRLSLEKMDVEDDIVFFIKEKGTGQEIPDPPKYINFCRGDVDEPQPEPVEEENYSVAQFPRNINPAFRTSSPQPSTYESHHDPNSALARDLGHHDPAGASSSEAIPPSQQAAVPVIPPQDLPPQARHPQERHLHDRHPQDMPPQPRQLQERHLRDRQPQEIPPQDRHPQERRLHDKHPPSRHSQDRHPQDRHPQDRHPQDVYQTNAVQRYRPYYDPAPPHGRDMGRHDPARASAREQAQPPQKPPFPVMPPQDRRHGNGMQQYDAPQFAAVPHEPYPMDGMTMLCRTDGMNSATSSNLSARPSSQDENSDYSNPTSLSSQEPPSGNISPVKQEPVKQEPIKQEPIKREPIRSEPVKQEPVKPEPVKQEPATQEQPDKRILKKRSAFFQNHSPFRRKSIKESQAPNRNTWGPVSSSQNGPVSSSQNGPISSSQNGPVSSSQNGPVSSSQPRPISPSQSGPVTSPTSGALIKPLSGSGPRRPQVYQPPETQRLQKLQNMIADRAASPEPIDANASLALNIGQNVFPVARPDANKKSVENSAPPQEEDPIALALAELKEVAGNKHSSGRISADHYHGLATPAPAPATAPATTPAPAPDRAADRPKSQAFSRSKTSSDVAAAVRGTPPPSYDQQITRLGVPPPAVTSKAMQASSRKYTEQTREMFQSTRPGSSYTGSTPARPTTRGTDIPRAASPAPPRGASPRPGLHVDTQQPPRSASPNPYNGSQSPAQRSPSPNPYSASQNQTQSAPSPTPYSADQSQTQRTAPPSSYGINKSQTQKSASPSTYSIRHNQARKDTSPTPYSANQAQTPKTTQPSAYSMSQNQAQKVASPTPYSANQAQTPKTTQPSTYSMSQNQAQKAASPTPYSSAPAQTQKTSQPSSYAASQSPMQRTASPNPYNRNQQQGQRAPSPNPYAGSPQPRRDSVSPSPYAASPLRNSTSSVTGTMSKRGSEQGYFPHNSPSEAMRASSPSVYRGDHGRPSSRGDYGRPSSRGDYGRPSSRGDYGRPTSRGDYGRPASRGDYGRPPSQAGDMAIQLAPVGGDPYGSVRSRNGRPGTSSSSRTGAGIGAMTFYDGRDPMQDGSRQRSQSVADPSRQYTPDGRAILHYARALYMYQAAIPEELGFNKGDILSILRHQDDGWWEAEIHSGNGVGMNGLVPSNYLQNIREAYVDVWTDDFHQSQSRDAKVGPPLINDVDRSAGQWRGSSCGSAAKSSVHVPGTGCNNRFAAAILPTNNFNRFLDLPPSPSRAARCTAPNGAFASPFPASPNKMGFVRDSVQNVTSPAAQRKYLGTVLLFAASLALLCIAALAYPIFYYSYVPKKVVSTPVHLQYNAGLNPYGVTHLSSELMLEQAYDVSVELSLPRSPPNVERGNFMVAMFAMKSQPENPALAFTVPSDPYAHVTPGNVVFSSRRPAIIPYRDPVVARTSRLLFLPYHIFSPAAETSKLVIPMGELVEFKQALPLSILLDIQAGQTLQVYSASITLVARLSGVRWVMYNHRVLSFVVCTTAFWLAEMLSMGAAWLLMVYCVSGRQNGNAANKQKLAGKARAGLAGMSREGVADKPFYEVKQEDDDDVKIKEESTELETLVDQPQHGGDADDEEDGDEIWKESRSGASGFYDGKGASLRRRASRGGQSW
ncbi:hypothetical protein DL770_005503 [Monosporascus sp. CRB-9-2]|nr:hypothetical protein DL770_005503 [Monosporascus sp. CRB-9-2]